MHDTNPNKEERMPPLVVLGLTGPVCSGCSTFGWLLEGGNLMYNLRLLEWVAPKKEQEKLSIEWTGLNAEVDNKYAKLAKVREIMSAYDKCIEENGSKELNEKEGELRTEVKQVFGKNWEGDFREGLQEFETDIMGEFVKILEVREEVKALVPFQVSEFCTLHMLRPLSSENDDKISNLSN